MITKENVKRFIRLSDEARYPVTECEDALVFDLAPTGSITKRIVSETMYDLDADENLQDNWFDIEAHAHPIGTLDLVVKLGGSNDVNQVDHFGKHYVELSLEEEMTVLDEVRRQWNHNSSPNFKAMFKELEEAR